MQAPPSLDIIVHQKIKFQIGGAAGRKGQSLPDSAPSPDVLPRFLRTAHFSKVCSPFPLAWYIHIAAVFCKIIFPGSRTRRCRDGQRIHEIGSRTFCP